MSNKAIFHLTKDGKTTLCGRKDGKKIHVTYANSVANSVLDIGRWCIVCQKIHGKENK